MQESKLRKAIIFNAIKEMFSVVVLTLNSQYSSSLGFAHIIDSYHRIFSTIYYLRLNQIQRIDVSILFWLHVLYRFPVFIPCYFW